jgi:hypothetical protein
MDHIRLGNKSDGISLLIARYHLEHVELEREQTFLDQDISPNDDSIVQMVLFTI